MYRADSYKISAQQKALFVIVRLKIIFHTAYLVWAIVNIGLLLFFVFICFRATKLIREKSGLFSSIIFVFALLSFSFPNNNAPKTGDTFNLKFDKDANKNSNNRNAQVMLDDNLIFSTNLYIDYSKSADTLLSVTSASSNMTGLVAGHRWKAQNITADVVEQTIRYKVIGSVEWKLLGLTIYTQSEMYTGSVDTK